MTKVRKFLNNYFSSKIGKKNLTSLKKKDLIESGIMDSLDIVTLSVMVKKKFNIELQFTNQKSINVFKSYNAILNAIKKNEK